MNERIRQLAEQALFESEFDDEQNIKITMDIFAELIVKDCVDLLREESERLYKLAAEEKDELFARNFEVGAEKCWDNEVMIKEHFGVEE
jgi:transcription termination factor NusB